MCCEKSVTNLSVANISKNNAYYYATYYNDYRSYVSPILLERSIYPYGKSVHGLVGNERQNISEI